LEADRTEQPVPNFLKMDNNPIFKGTEKTMAVWRVTSGV